MENIFARQVKAFVERSMYANALVLCEQYLSAKGTSESTIEIIYLMGLCHFRMKKYRQAQMILSQVSTTTICASGPLCDEYMLLLAQCALELGHHALALSHIQATSFFLAYSVTPYRSGDELPPPMPNLDAKDPMLASIVFYTLGKIYQGIKSTESAAGAFVQSLYANPFMFVAFQELSSMGFFPVSSSEEVCNKFFSQRSLNKMSPSNAVPPKPMFESPLNTSSELKRKHEQGEQEKEEHEEDEDKKKQISQSNPPIAKKARKVDGSEIECIQANETECTASRIIGTYGRLYNALSQYNLSEFNSVLDFKECPPNMRSSPFVNIMKGKAYLDSNNHLEAERLFAQAHKAAPYVLKGMEYYSTTLWRMNKTALLTNLAYSMMNIDKLAPETLCATGNCFSQRGDHRSALKLFARAAQVDENYAYAYFLAGDEYSSVDNLDKATASFLLAHNRQPRDVGCLLGLARIMLKRGNRDQANCYFSMALKVDPTSTAAHSYLAVSFLMEGMPDMALKETELAIKYSPSNTFARVKRVEALIALNRVSEACMELKALEPLVPVAALSGLRAEAAKRLKDTLTEASAKSAAIDIESGTSRLLKSIRNNHEILTALNSIPGAGRPVSIASSGIAGNGGANGNGAGNNAQNRRHSIEQNNLDDSLHMSGRMGPPVVVSSISPPGRRGGGGGQQQQIPQPPPSRRDIAPVRMLNFSDELSSVSGDGIDPSTSMNSIDSSLPVRLQQPPSQQQQQHQQLESSITLQRPDTGLQQQQQQSTPTTSTQQQQQAPAAPPPAPVPQHRRQQQQQPQPRLQVPTTAQRLEFLSGSSPVTRTFDTTPRVTSGAGALAAVAALTSTVGVQRDANMSGISPLPHQPPPSRPVRGPIFDASTGSDISGAGSSGGNAGQSHGANARALGIIPLNLNSFSSDDSRDYQGNNSLGGGGAAGSGNNVSTVGDVSIDGGVANLSEDRNDGQQQQFPVSSYVTPPTGQPPQTPGSVFSLRRRRRSACVRGGSGNNDSSGELDSSIGSNNTNNNNNNNGGGDN